MIKMQPHLYIKTMNFNGDWQQLLRAVTLHFVCVWMNKEENGFIHVSSSLLECARGSPSLH